MLVLSRKQGEGITIGDNLKVKILDIKGRQVRIGIEAPPDYFIYREEVYEKILVENRKAASPDSEKIESIVNNISGLIQKKG